MTASTPDISLSASLICCDLCNIEAELRNLESAGVDYLHVDLIDGHFSPSLPMGVEVVQQARKKTALPFDVHLMVENNEFFIEEMLTVGVQRVCFHYESARHVDRLLCLIRDGGAKAGVALMPTTPFSVLEYCVDRLDFVLLMLINPGYAGRKGENQVPYALRRVADCRRFLAERGLDIPIEVDGRVAFGNIPDLIAAGATDLVAGSSSAFHKGGTLAENIARMRALIAQAGP
ncbi:ribulose-phosphate 3-epimerase [Methylogaea oryzae]|uniref:Ribulose-phosphate 3-epimerase n=1 Tax=Methylogaea oryzae TaxID=1295382 RepID=A0A8D5AI31_9GAMM|nr:ribulose-phosphate 3-epimerase [Methylogaea oryzae]BBL70916.1 ribulose-phosphate 3-epimerase [Methylogaea oryzae]